MDFKFNKKFFVKLLSILMMISGIIYFLGQSRHEIKLADSVSSVSEINAQAKTLYNEGLEDFLSHHYKSAIEKFEKALKLAPEFKSAQIKRDAVKFQLAQNIEELNTRGTVYYNSLRYKEAALEWQKALSLLNDHDEKYKKLSEQIEQSKIKLKEIKGETL